MNMTLASDLSTCFFVNVIVSLNGQINDQFGRHYFSKDEQLPNSNEGQQNL